MEERVRDEPAGEQRDQAAQCQDHDLGCNHEAVPTDLDLPEGWAWLPSREGLGAWPGGRRGLL
jgi:hypothetical protein